MTLTTYDRGMVVGERKALRRMILQLASRQCGVPDKMIRDTIHAIEDVTQLDDLVDAALTAESWKQLLGTE